MRKWSLWFLHQDTGSSLVQWDSIIYYSLIYLAHNLTRLEMLLDVGEIVRDGHFSVLVKI